jgi:hypothetical protein
MTRDGNCQVVFGARLRNGTNSLRTPDALRNLSVAGRVAWTDRAQRAPYSLLKDRPTNVERQVEPERWSLHERHHASDELLEGGISSDQLGIRKLVLEVAHQLLGIVAEQNRADASLGPCNDDVPERAAPDREANLRVRSARAVLLRLHAEEALRDLVKASVGAEPRIVDHARD